MKVYNTRSPQQWEIIRNEIDVERKMIVDFGCGRADILWQAVQAGAWLCHGIDVDEGIIKLNRQRADRLRHSGKDWEQQIFFSKADLDSHLSQAIFYDIGICFSVLPYLDHPEALLKTMRDLCAVSLVEVQYKGDGPGTLAGDDEARALFEKVGFTTIEPIGYTLVDYRDAKRVIWKLKYDNFQGKRDTS